MTNQSNGFDWRTIGLAGAALSAFIFIAWAAWATLSWLVGTTLGRAVLGVAVLAAALYAILKDDDFDPDDALLDRFDDGADDTEAEFEPLVCSECGQEFTADDYDTKADAGRALGGHRSGHTRQENADGE